MHRRIILFFLLGQLSIGACVDLRRPTAKPSLDVAQDYQEPDARIMIEPDVIEPDVEPVLEPRIEPIVEVTVEPPPIEPPSYDAEVTDSHPFTDAETHKSTFNCPEVLFHVPGKTTIFPGTGAWCVMTCDDFTPHDFGWDCYNFEKRTLKVNGKPTACGSKPLPSPINGFTIFEVSSGNNTYSAINWWNSISKTKCSLPEGGF
jgi:hypothetical protein